MQKITPRIQRKIAKNTLGRRLKDQWDSGASFRVSMDWDADKYIISAREVRETVIKQLNRSASLRKLHVLGINVNIEYVR